MFHVQITLADMYLAATNGYLKHAAGRDIFADYPNLVKVIENVNSVPSISKYIAQRPETLF